MSKKLINALINMQDDEAIEITKSLLADNEDPIKILNDCSAAMEEVGKRFEKGEYYLPELMMAGDMLKNISDIVKPKLSGAATSQKKGKVLIGTVQGDIHNIGKDIVTFMLDINGYEVCDIGIDVPADRFVKEIINFQPMVVGLSCLLTLAFDSLKNTIQAIEKAGLRRNVKIIIGGSQLDENIMKFVGADGFAKDAIDGVKYVRKWIAEN